MQAHRKILFLPRWYPNQYDVQNGVFIQKHARAAAVNNEVLVLLAAPAPAGSPIVKSQNGNLTELFIYYRPTSFRWVNFISYLIALFKGWRLVRSAGFRPDLCHVNMLNRPALLALWLQWRFAIPFMLSEHWSSYLTGQFERQSALKKWFSRIVARKASIVTAVSEPLKEAMRRCGLNGNFRLLANVVEVPHHSWNQQPLSNVFRYLVVADLKDEVKNISGVIRAFAETHKNDPATELIIIGDGQDRRMLEQQVSDAAPSVPVQFVGEKPNDEVLKVIPSAHVLVVNSRIETFSVVTLEAIFSGRPVIATRCGGPERFINEQNGILIEKDNDKKLVEAMIKIKKEYANYPAEKVRNSIRDNFSINSIAVVLDRYYEEVLSNSPFVTRNS